MCTRECPIRIKACKLELESISTSIYMHVAAGRTLANDLTDGID